MTILLYSEGKTDCDSGFFHLSRYNFQKAIYFFKKSCNSGYGRGCLEVAQIYNYSKGVKRDRYKAYKFYQKSCLLNNSMGCVYLGQFYENGIAVKKDNLIALEKYAHSCDMGNGAGCSSLGILYRDGKGIEQNISKAKLYLDKGCSLKSGLGCIELARLNLKTSKTEESYINAISIYTQRCSRFYNNASLYLGDIYRDNNSKFYYFNKSKEYLTKACDFDNNEACLILKNPNLELENNILPTPHSISKEEYYDTGMRYFRGDNIRQNTLLSKKYFKISCYLDYIPACNMLGFIYEYDDKGIKNLNMANRYYKRACFLGDNYSCETLLSCSKTHTENR